MIVYHQIVDRAKRNGSSRFPGTTASMVVDALVKRTSPGAEPVARKILKMMTQNRWVVLWEAHVSASDRTRHLTARVGGDCYHFRLDGRDCIMDITRIVGAEDELRVDRLGHAAPWRSPGSVAGS